MSENNRKGPVGRQPVTRHPLFPAIVALWFGALFGLGSLAIRPALIEQMVVAGGIDSVIPMAAPPLGVTMRILLALAMTGLGGLIGALIARQISKPAAEKHERRRAPRAATVQDGDTLVAAPVASSPRRRSLAMSENNEPTGNYDEAPVPGHSARILDVAEFELEGFEHLDQVEPADMAPALVDTTADESDAHEEAYTPREPAFLTSADAQDEPEEAFEAHVPEGAQQFMPIADSREVAEPADEYEPAAPELHERDSHESDHRMDFARDSERQTFAAPPSFSEDEDGDEDDVAEFVEISPAPSAEGRSPLSNKLFEAYSREISARAERASDAEAAPLFDRPDASSDVAETPQVLPRFALGDWDETELEDTSETPEQHEPLFPPRAVPASTRDEMLDLANEAQDVEHDEDYADEPVASFMPEAARAPSAYEDFGADHDETDEVFHEPEDESGLVADADDPSEHPVVESRIATTPLEELAPVELLERLAMSMARRRAKAATQAAASLAEAATVEAVLPEQERGEPSNPWSGILPITTHDVDDFEDDSDDTIGDARDEDFRETFDAFEDDEAELELEAEAALEDEAELEPEEPQAPMAVEPPAAPRAVPAALRPVSFESDDEDEELPGYVPPRSIGMMASAAVPTAFGEPAGDDGDTDTDDDDDALEEGYSSLLNLSRPFERPEFVRIDEPEAESDDEVRPFVVFPGEQAGSRDEAAPAHDVAASDDRPFDPPAVTDPSVEAEENERRLRAALANLQRISGAA